MFRWLKKAALRWAMRQIKKRVESLEGKEPKLREFRAKLYHAPISEFVAWGTRELVADASIPDSHSVIDYVKDLIEPLEDGLEGLVREALEELAP